MNDTDDILSHQCTLHSTSAVNRACVVLRGGCRHERHRIEYNGLSA
jgi:hypothetical protein